MLLSTHRTLVRSDLVGHARITHAEWIYFVIGVDFLLDRILHQVLHSERLGRRNVLRVHWQIDA